LKGIARQTFTNPVSTRYIEGETTMKKTALAVIAFGIFVLPAQARTALLSGKKADAFVAKHFPNADIPGDVDGRFSYVAGGRERFGRAHCHVPAMGERSNGVVSSCTVRY
jgi:hypothetical protein